MESFFEFVQISAQRALLYEALLSPKPGLVDRFDNGAHSDMDIYSFVDSSLVIGDYFKETCKVGYNKPIDKIMGLIRPLGIEAEEEMFQITKGVNVHKGAIFLYGIICASLGYLKARDKDLSVDIILDTGRQLAGDLNKDFKDLDKRNLSYGEKQYVKYGIKGIRGEVMGGFKSVKKAYKVFVESMATYKDLHICLGNSLLYLMSFVYDSNVLGRGGIEALRYMHKSSKDILDIGGYASKEGIDAVKNLNDIFIDMNISPGGCADLASLVLFLYFLRDY